MIAPREKRTVLKEVYILHFLSVNTLTIFLVKLTTNFLVNESLLVNI